LADIPAPPGPAAPTPVEGPARCARHPDKVAAGVCENCGTFSCPDCLGYLGSRRICITCVTERRVTAFGIPWEKRKQIGLFKAWGLTTWEVISRPIDFYRRVDPKGSVGESILYSLMSFSFLATIWIILIGLVVGLVMLVALMEGGLGAAELAVIAGVAAFYGAMFTIVPFVVLLVTTLVHHVVLIVLGGGKQGLGASMRVTQYASALVILQGIPCLNYIAWVWYSVLFGLGYHNVHKGEAWHAVVAVLTPFACWCCCMALYMGLVLSLGA
jgi:hypothetical protein